MDLIAQGQIATNFIAPSIRPPGRVERVLARSDAGPGPGAPSWLIRFLGSGPTASGTGFLSQATTRISSTM